MDNNWMLKICVDCDHRRCYMYDVDVHYKNAHYDYECLLDKERYIIDNKCKYYKKAVINHDVIDTW